MGYLNNNKKKVLVALSGGVDSSTAALLMKKKGYKVAGATMCLGVKKSSNKLQCCDAKAIEDARKICRMLEIPHRVFDFSGQLEDKVIGKFAREYSLGRTPNPCVDCNRYLKFDLLLNKALALGFDYLATGHYARILNKSDEYYLSRPKDKVKDQSYFLYPIKKEALKYIIFPLEEYTKEEVRKICKKHGLPVAEKPQSQDLCFAGSDDFKGIFEARMKTVKEGPITDINGKVLGRHRGICFYTIGQRRGLGISSKDPLYVIGIDTEHNRIIAGDRSLLGSKGLIADNVNYFMEKIPENTTAQIRYNHKAARCKAVRENGMLRIKFDRVQEAVTPGQSAVVYSGDIVVAGGEIKSVIK